MTQGNSSGTNKAQVNEKKYWQSCLFLRNLPSGISQERIAEWVTETFQQQPTRVAFADEASTDQTRSGSYLIELTPQSVLNIFASQGHKIQHMFSVSLLCEEVRSEQFAKSCFSESNQISDEQDTSLAKRCLVFRQFSEDTFPVSEKSLMQLFQGCLGEKVKQAVTINQKERRRRNTNTKMIVEFVSEDNVACIMLAFDDESFSLGIPVKIQAATKRSGNFAKKCLSKVDKLQHGDQSPANPPEPAGKKRENQQTTKKGKPETSTVLLGHNLDSQMNGAEKKPQDEKEINNPRYTVAAIERRTRIKHGITTGRKPVHPNDENSNATSMKRKSDLEEEVKSVEQETAALSEHTKKMEQEIQKLRNELKRKENLLRQTQKAAAEAELKADRKLSEKSEMVEDLKMELREKDALLGKSKQVEGEFRSQIENEISEKTALKTENAAVLKDQQAKHEKECLQYENQVRELQQKLDFCNEATAAA
jgi:hypothetical protein